MKILSKIQGTNDTLDEYGITDAVSPSDLESILRDNLTSGGKINLASATASSLSSVMNKLGTNGICFYIITDSSGDLPSLKGETFIKVEGIAKLLLFGKTEPFGANVGDILAVTKLSCRIIPLNDAKPATSMYGEVGTDGLCSAWDKGQINKIAGVESTANNALPKQDRLPSIWLDNMNNALETGIYPWCTLGRPSGRTSPYTCIVDKSSTPDSNGYYTITQTAFGRENDLGRVYKRIIFYKDANTFEYGEWQWLNEKLAMVATSGSYTDLSDKPNIPKVVNDFTTSTTDALSAAQGYLLNLELSDLNGRIKELEDKVAALEQRLT